MTGRLVAWLRGGRSRPLLALGLVVLLCVAARQWRFASAHVLIAGPFVAPLFIWLGAARSRLARPLAIALAVALPVLYALSTWQPGTIAPPRHDWMFAYAMVAYPLCALGLAWDRSRVDQPTRRYAIGAGALAVGVLVVGVIGFAVTSDGHRSLSTLKSQAEAVEVLPLPPGLTVAAEERRCGSSGFCDVLMTVTGAPGQAPDEIADRLAAHLVDTGWQENHDGSYDKPVGGLLDWHEHTARITRAGDAVVLQLA
ncbi:hypothetical protein GCM10009681_28090 [Luedemannella helvata]|uniref:Uncharacterized protein n=2 Tax=Luedemannella helvata TaxID=349315 RepID=A0ABP4WIF0_9ACTN